MVDGFFFPENTERDKSLPFYTVCNPDHKPNGYTVMSKSL